MPETINSLIKAIKKKNEEENNDCQWILLVDELIARNGDDFTSLCILEDIDVLIGVSPNSKSSISYNFEIFLPNNTGIIAKRLVFKHRNSLELNVFLAHLNFHFAKEAMFTPMSSDEDMPLVDSCFPAIDKVICALKVAKTQNRQNQILKLQFSCRTFSIEEILFGFWLRQICLMLKSLKPSE